MMPLKERVLNVGVIVLVFLVIAGLLFYFDGFQRKSTQPAAPVATDNGPASPPASGAVTQPEQRYYEGDAQPRSVEEIGKKARESRARRERRKEELRRMQEERGGKR